MAGHPSRALVPALRERWLGWRNRLVARPDFQRWAAGFPLTRRIARGNTRALFDLCAGFVYAQVLTAGVRLDLFGVLAAGPLGPDALARRLELPEAGALRLARAAVALDLLRRLPDGRFALADLGAALIGNPAIAAMIEHHAMLYADLADPVALLRGAAPPTQLSGYWPYADGGTEIREETITPYSRLMAASQALIAGDILDAYPVARHACLMDVGGGEGAFLAAAAARAPNLRLMLFDLPPVAARARTRLAAAGLARVACHGGSFRDAALPGGADAITLVRIVHDHDDATVRGLLAAVHAALPPGGSLILAEPMAGTPGAEAAGDAYFGFYLMAMGNGPTDSGRPRTADELRGLLARAGFARVREARTRRPLLTRVLVARKP